MARVNWYIRATVECPHCEHDHDFMDVEDWYSYCGMGENCDFSTPCEITCDNCNKEFQVVGSDY